MFFKAFYFIIRSTCTDSSSNRKQARDFSFSQPIYRSRDFEKIDEMLKLGSAQYEELAKEITEILAKPFTPGNKKEFDDGFAGQTDGRESKGNNNDKDNQSAEPESDSKTETYSNPDDKEQKYSSNTTNDGPIINEYETIEIEKDNQTGKQRVTKTIVKEVNNGFTGENGERISEFCVTKKIESTYK